MAFLIVRPASADDARARDGAGADSPGRTAVSRRATRTPGISIPRLPGRPKPVTSAVISGGPRATPTLPPVEKMETPVTLRGPATAVAVR